MAAEPGALQVFGLTDLSEVFVAPLGEALADLQVGEVSPLLECYGGTLHLFRVESRDPGTEWHSHTLHLTWTHLPLARQAQAHPLLR